MLSKLSLLLLIAAALPAHANPTQLAIFNQIKNIGFNTPEKDFSIDRIEIATVPTIIDRDTTCEEDCSPYKVLESNSVVQVQFSYNDNDSSLDDSTTSSIEVNFPMELFSAAELSEIKNKSSFTFDFTGEKTRALKKLANQLIGFESTVKTRVAKDIDYEKSRCNYASDNFEETVCDVIVYKDVVIKSKAIKFSKK